MLHEAGSDADTVLAVGLDTPGPATAGGVISRRGSTNFAQQEWWGFDVRAAVEDALRLPVIYNNDGNAAALYAHQQHYGAVSTQRSSVSAIVGTGLGGGVVEMGAIVRGATGMAGELGHVHIPAARVCWSTGSRCRAATAGSWATWRALPRSAASRTTCCRSG